MKTTCLLIANGIGPVCGNFNIRVGKATLHELKLWLDELAKTSESTALFGMVVWSNEDLNMNIKAAGEKRG